MNVLYVTRAKLSLSRAHTQNILKTAEYLNEYDELSVVVFSSAIEPKNVQEIFDAKMVKQPFLLDIASKRRSLFLMIVRDRKNFDLLYFRDPMLWPQAFFVRLILGKKVVFEVHGSHEWRFAKLWWKFSLASAHGLVFITDGLKQYYQTKKENVVAHTNGVELEKYDAFLDMLALRKNLNLPIDKKIIMYVGSFLWHSIELLADISRTLPADAVLVVVGLARRERANILPQSVICIERVESKEVPRYLLAADILINPLSIEFPGSISSKLYEYLAAGKPIVSTKGGANNEILIDGENALIVDDITVESFERAIKKVLENSDLRRILSENALVSARKYTWQARAKKIASLLKQL